MAFGKEHIWRTDSIVFCIQYAILIVEATFDVPDDALNRGFAGEKPGIERARRLRQRSRQAARGGIIWRKRVRVERTIDIEDADRRF